MSDPFIAWLFVTHWIASTLLMPGLTFLYAVFDGNVGWAAGCAAVQLIWWSSSKS